MPGLNGTGPRGTGPMTGGGRGFCALTADGVRSFPGRGAYGRGGRGYRNQYYATGMPVWQRAGYYAPNPYIEPTAVEEKEMLMREAELLKKELEALQGRINTLEATQEKN